MTKSAIRQDIQGMRGISILSVLIYHATPRFLPGGFAGVDIFFVISGFVITNTILRDIAAGEFSVAGFYRRRIRRIFPALFAMLAFTFLASWFLLPPNDFLEFGKTALSAVFFSSNFMFRTLSGYFAGSANWKPLLHTWSLSVEEQFYVAYPIFVVLVSRILPRMLRPLLILTALASLALSIWMVHGHPIAAFLLAPPRAFELLAGAIVACPGLHQINQRARDGMSLIGIACIAVAFWAFNPEAPFPGLAALLPCLGAALIIWAGTGDGVSSLGGKILSTRFLVFFGALSYSLYLWHWPILVMARRALGGDFNLFAGVTCIVASVLASMLSLRFIEKPFLDKRRAGLPYLRLGLSTMAIASFLCAAVVVAKGVPERFTPSTLAIFATSEDYNHSRARCHDEGGGLLRYDQSCTFGAPGAVPDMAVWGDSEGAELVAAVGERLAPKRRSVMEITASSCPPALGFIPKDRPNCATHNQETLRRLIADKRISTVILTAHFSTYEGKRLQTMINGFREAVEGLHAAGKRIILIYPIPTYDFDPPTILGLRNQVGLPLGEVGMPRQAFEKANDRAIAFLNGIYQSGVAERVIAADQTCDAQRCRVFAPNGEVLYFDGFHLSMVGSRLVAATVPLEKQ